MALDINLMPLQVKLWQCSNRFLVKMTLVKFQLKLFISGIALVKQKKSQFWFRSVVFNLGLFSFFRGVATASDKSIHNFFYTLHFVYATMFCCSQKNIITWQNR